MKFLRAIAMAALISMATLIPASALAQTGSGTNMALNKEDVKQIQEASRGLNQVFGIEAPAPKPTELSEQPQQKTLTDVADKAVDMVGRLVATAAATLQKVAPDVWRIMIKQQYAKALGDLLLPWLLFFGGIVLSSIKAGSWKLEANPSSDELAARLLVVVAAPAVVCALTFIWGAVALKNSIMLLVNPEFYAIRDLLIMLLNKGQTP